MTDNKDELSFDSSDVKSIPDAHYAAIGRVVDAWADLEFEIDQLIWLLMNVQQPFGACVTAQLISIHPRIDALKSLVAIWEINQSIVDDLNKFYSKTISPLVPKRHRIIHDKRLTREKTQEVVRFEISAKGKLSFEPKAETVTDLDKFREEIISARGEFSAIHDRIIDDLLASRNKQRKPLPYIARRSDRKPIPANEEK